MGEGVRRLGEGSKLILSSLAVPAAVTGWELEKRFTFLGV